MSAVQRVEAGGPIRVQWGDQQAAEESCSEKVERVKEESLGCLLACFQFLGGNCCCLCPTPYPSERIYDAAKKGDMGGLDFWIWVNGDRAIETTPGYRVPGSALHIAVNNGRRDVVRVLLEARVDVNQRNQRNQRNFRGVTPLHIAAEKSDVPMAQILLEAGADVDLKEDKLYGSLHTPLEKAAIRGDLEIMRVLIEDPNEEKRSERFQRAIVVAAKNGHAGAVQELLNEIGVANVSFDERQEALHEAIRLGHAGVVRVLVTTDRGLLDARDGQGKTVVQIAAECGNMGVVEVLLELAVDAEDRTEKWRLALHCAVSKRRLSAVNALAGMDRNALVGIGPQVLFIAAEKGFLDIINALLRFQEIDVDAYLAEKTALHVAVQAGCSSIVRALIEAGSDVNALFDEKTVLNYVEYIRYAPVSSRLPREFYRRDESPDRIIYVNTYPHSQERVRIMRALIEAGANINPFLKKLGIRDRESVMKSLQILKELQEALELIGRQGVFIEPEEVRTRLSSIDYSLFKQNDLLDIVMSYDDQKSIILNGKRWLHIRKAHEVVSWKMKDLNKLLRSGRLVN